MEEKIIFNSEDVQKNKIMAVLAYFGILFLVPFLAAEDSQFAKFHANQGIILFITDSILSLVAVLFNFLVGWLPFVGPVLGGVISFAAFGIGTALFIIGLINVFSGEPKKLPIIGDFVIIK